MPVPPAIRSLIPLLAGLIVGGVGATLFVESMPGSEGSPQERANKLEAELKQAKNRLAALEAEHPGEADARGVFKRSLKDGMRTIGEDIRAGRPVTPEDIFRASQPLMRDLAPLFDRMRLKEQRRMIDSMTGELARKYNLSPEKQAALKVWFEEKSAEEAKKWSEMIGRDGTRLEDVMKASANVRPDAGLDAFMETMLTGDQLASFKTERVNERAQKVQQHADAKVQRLDSIVKLNDVQREQVFGIMARSSPDYDKAMALDGAHGEIPATPGGDPHAAMLSVLTPDQRVAYDAELRRRREEASKDLEAVGLALPPNWEMLDESNF